MFDMLISGGTIVDGSGKPGYRGEVGIKDGRIVALGAVEGQAATVIDATGKIVAPGFIDIHTHYDAQIFWDRMLSVSPWHGVTTVIMGNCGFAIAPTRQAHQELIVQSLERVEGMNSDTLREGIGRWPFESFPQYLEAVASRGVAINVGVLAGHLATRFYVMGEEAVGRESTSDELRQMTRLVTEAMDAGAFGFSTSYGASHVGWKGLPVASRYASFEETRTLAGVLKKFPGAVFSPNLGADLNFDQLGLIAKDTDANVMWAALVTSEVVSDSNPDEQMRRTRQYVAQGLRMNAQFSPRPIMFEYQFASPLLFEAMPAFGAATKADAAGRLRLFADPTFRRGFCEAVDARHAGFREAVARTRVGDGSDPALLDRYLGDLARERGISPIEVALDLAIESKLEARFRMPLGNHLDEKVQPFLRDPNTAISLSDAGAHASQLCDACIPTFLLRRWVREKNVLTLEEGVRQLTSRLADLYQIKDRGRLQIGKPADVVVFDAATVCDGPLRRVWDLPAGGNRLVSDGIGIDAVIVNGTLIRRHGGDVIDKNGPLPGQVLRRAA
jgi:N-acyl-D-amino-acid deacylase